MKTVQKIVIIIMMITLAACSAVNTDAISEQIMTTANEFVQALTTSDIDSINQHLQKKDHLSKEPQDDNQAPVGALLDVTSRLFDKETFKVKKIQSQTKDQAQVIIEVQVMSSKNLTALAREISEHVQSKALSNVNENLQLFLDQFIRKYQQSAKTTQESVLHLRKTDAGWKVASLEAENKEFLNPLIKMFNVSMP